MNLWRLELLRIARTKRWMVLLAVYVFFGFLGPVTARYLEDLVSLAGSELDGVTIEFPEPIAADGMAQYVSNAVQIGTLVTVVVAAGALAFDAVPEMGIFLRTRVTSKWRILLPRLVVSFLGAAAAYTIGVLAAWYETWALIGALDAGSVIAGTALGVVYLAFVVALVAAIAQWARSVLATVMATLIALLVLPVIGVADAVGRWLPSSLATALTDLTAGGTLSDYIGSTAVSLAAIAALVRTAVTGANRREL